MDSLLHELPDKHRTLEQTKHEAKSRLIHFELLRPKWEDQQRLIVEKKRIEEKIANGRSILEKITAELEEVRHFGTKIDRKLIRFRLIHSINLCNIANR